MHEAVVAGRQEAVERLLNCGAAVMSTEMLLGHTPLHDAAVANRLVIAKMLLDHGAAPDARDAAGGTPIDLAARKGHLKMIDLLHE